MMGNIMQKYGPKIKVATLGQQKMTSMDYYEIMLYSIFFYWKFVKMLEFRNKFRSFVQKSFSLICSWVWVCLNFRPELSPKNFFTKEVSVVVHRILGGQMTTYFAAGNKRHLTVCKYRINLSSCPFFRSKIKHNLGNIFFYKH